jgi:hypothetical protein
MPLALLTLFAARRPQFGQIFLGEWTATINHDRFYLDNVLTELSIEFHATQEAIITEGTIWRDDLNTADFSDIESFLTAHLEIEWESGTLGHVFTMQPQRKLLTHLEFQPVTGEATYSATAKVGPSLIFNLSVINQSYMKAIINPGSFKYEIQRVTVAERKEVSFHSWIAIGAVTVAFQIPLCTLLWRYGRKTNDGVDKETKDPADEANNAEQQRKKVKAD